MGPDEFPVLKALQDPALAQNPGPFFAVAHQYPGPGVFRDPNEGGLVVTRYATLKWISRHPAFQAQDRTVRVSGPSAAGYLKRTFDHHPVFMNEPVHMAVHRAAYRAVAWPGAAAIRSQIHAIATEVLDQLLQKRQVDLVSDYAFVISSRYWAQQLGLSQCDAMRLQNWARSLGVPLAFKPSDHEREQADQAARNIWNAISLQYDNISESESESTYGVVDALLQEIEIEGKPQGAAALLAAMTFDAIDGAGGMTANLLHCVLEDVASLTTLRKDPTHIAAAWSEATRVAPALLGLFRCPVEDVLYDGITFPAFTNILMLNAAGNRDPDVFSDPDKFDVFRKGPQALSFGGGGRACIGRSLAKIQGEVSLDVLLKNTKTVHLVDASVDWGPPGLLRAVQRLPVELTPR